jgi:hypothetical protein
MRQEGGPFVEERLLWFKSCSGRGHGILSQSFLIRIIIGCAVCGVLQDTGAQRMLTHADVCRRGARSA